MKGRVLHVCLLHDAEVCGTARKNENGGAVHRKMDHSRGVAQRKVYKTPQPSLKMAWIYVGNQQDGLWLGEGYSPDGATLERAAQRLAPYRCGDLLPVVAPPKVEKYNDLLAWVANASVWRRLQEKDPVPQQNLPLETWVLEPASSSQGAFQPWFTNVSPRRHTARAPQAESYRLLIHHHANTQNGYASRYNVWFKFYQQLSVYHRAGPWQPLVRETKPYLFTMLETLPRGPPAVADFLEKCGHPFGYARNPL